MVRKSRGTLPVREKGLKEREREVRYLVLILAGTEGWCLRSRWGSDVAESCGRHLSRV